MGVRERVRESGRGDRQRERNNEKYIENSVYNC